MNDKKSIIKNKKIDQKEMAKKKKEFSAVNFHRTFYYHFRAILFLIISHFLLKTKPLCSLSVTKWLLQ